MNRVAITGAGTINSLGHSVKETLESMADGSCGIGALSFRDVDRLDIKIGGQVKDCRQRYLIASSYHCMTELLNLH